MALELRSGMSQGCPIIISGMSRGCPIIIRTLRSVSAT